MLKLCSSVTLTVQMPLTFFNLPNENALSSPELSFGEKAEFSKRSKWIFLSFNNRNPFQGTSNKAYFHASLWWRRLTTTSNVIHSYPHFCLFLYQACKCLRVMGQTEYLWQIYMHITLSSSSQSSKFCTNYSVLWVVHLLKCALPLHQK